MLRGQVGVSIDETDRAGRLLDRRQQRAAEPGRDLVVTLDPALQRTAEAHGNFWRVVHSPRQQ